MRRLGSVAVLLALFAGAAGWLPVERATGFPSAKDETTYAQFGRVFSDPHGCVSEAGGTAIPVSPWAKGNVCATQFLQWDDVIAGLKFLEQRFPRYLTVVNLREALSGKPGFAPEELQSAGLPQEDLSRLRRDLYAVKVTDAESSVPEAERKHFAYSLSIHGIERAGIEGGIRAIEDLVTWAACEESTSAAPACAQEGPFPKKILEPSNSGPEAGDVLRKGVVYFVLSNPDGWARGEVTEGGVYFQRYNGNGMDLNRDWPTIGYVEEQYTPASEPETRGYSKYLRAIRDRTAAKRFAGAIDLHGMLTSNSFSFTLLGAGQRDYRKNAVSVDTSIRTFEDSEARLTWSPLVAKSDSCPGPVPEPFFGRTTGPMCTDQWGTVWDTIRYQVTGSFGDWMDSPLGLDAVGIANEMALSHLSNCGVGSCFIPEVEQLHIDGNKGLIYSQIASLLEEKPVQFMPGGKVAYVFDARRIRNAGGAPIAPALAELPVQEPIEATKATGTEEFRFDVKGPSDGIYNGGVTVEVTFANVRGISNATESAVVLEDCGPPDHAGDPAGCREVARYFNQGSLYQQAGARIDLNNPRPGPYRIRPEGRRLHRTAYRVTFHKGPAHDVPTQAPYDVSRMDFFTDLNRYAAPGTALAPLTPEAIIASPAALSAYDSVILSGEFLPDAKRYSPAQSAAYAKAVRDFAAAGGNVVLLDGAMAGLPSLDARIKPEHVKRGFFFAGWFDFNDGNGPTYDHPLAKAVNKKGAAEGMGSIEGVTYSNRHQTYEPVPLGYDTSQSGSGNAACTIDTCDSPNWLVDRQAWESAGGSTAGRTVVLPTTEPPPGPTSPQGGLLEEPPSRALVGTALGELKIGKGAVRIAGAILPEPFEGNYHPYGLASYAVTYTGYQVFENLIAYRNPSRGAGGPPAGGGGGTRVGGTKQNRPLPHTGASDGIVPSALAMIAGAAIALRRRRTRAA